MGQDAFCRALLRCWCAGPLLLPALAGAAQGAPQGGSEVTTASESELESLLARYERAKEHEDSFEIAGVLGKMAAHDNVELLVPAKEALKYRASKVDKRAVRDEAAELGIRNTNEIERMTLAREAEVQATAARLIGNIPGKASTALLYKTFKDKKIRKGKPIVVAALIDAMGRLDFERALKDVHSEFNSEGPKEVMRACVRYFGQVRCKDKGVVRKLCRELSAPEPSNVDSATNPSASYWETRWKTWSYYRRDVSWSLKEITGQSFQPAEGGHDGDAQKALKYVKEHARELGLK